MRTVKRRTFISPRTLSIRLCHTEYIINLPPNRSAQADTTPMMTHVEVKYLLAYTNPSRAICCNLSGSSRYFWISVSIRSISQLGCSLIMKLDSWSSCSVGISPATTHPERNACAYCPVSICLLLLRQVRDGTRLSNEFTLYTRIKDTDPSFSHPFCEVFTQAPVGLIRPMTWCICFQAVFKQWRVGTDCITWMLVVFY